MKLNTTKLCLALMGCSLLVSLGSALAQEPQTPNLEGTYALETVEPCKLIKKEIEDTIKGMGFVKGKARSKLRDGNLPAPRMITIAYTSSEVTISSLPSGPMTTPLDGTFVKARRDADDIEIGTKWEGGKLQRTFRTPREQKVQGQRVNAYSLRDDGKLLMQVTTTSPRLKRPLYYELVYSRTTVDDQDLAYQKYPDCQEGYKRRGRIVITKAAKEAVAVIKEEFQNIEERKLAHARKGYDPQEISAAVQKGKDQLIIDLADRQELGGMLAYVEMHFIVPTAAELIDSPFGLASRKSKDRARENALQFLDHFDERSRVFDLQVNSDPPGATFVLTWRHIISRWITTNDSVKLVYRGSYNYKLSKPGFRDISFPIDLMNDITRLDCKLNRDTSTRCTEHSQ